MIMIEMNTRYNNVTKNADVLRKMNKNIQERIFNRMFDSVEQTVRTVGTASREKVTYRTSTPFDLRQPPLVWLLVLVEQRLDFLLPLALTDLVRVGHPEELRRNFDQPLRLNRSHVVAVFAGREDQLMVDAPLGIPVEECRGGVDVDGRALDQSLVTLLWVLLGRVSEEA